ncbi:MAG: DMT family transporter [Candidatus Nomurabacteria bacterium]|jgi:drug/metabolite transporter (DMT)-like permease|nr:DMT family transporter [Candidatus Nomurabacteria bacterium]
MEKLRQSNSKFIWVALAVLVMIAVVPNGTFTKLASFELDALTISALRYTMASLLLLPVFIINLKKHGRAVRKRLRFMILMSLPFSLGASLFTMALSLTSVSFVSILDLFSPIVFVIFSALIVKDRITRHAIAGMMLAVLGAVVIVVLPMVIGSGAVIEFGWLPLLLMMGFIIIEGTYPVYLRKVNETGVPIFSVTFIGFVWVAITSTIATFFVHGADSFAKIGELSPTGWLVIAYGAIMISIIARAANIKIYEKIGTATTAAISYLYYFLAILLPVLIFHENLSWEMFVGAALVIAGIFVTRRHPHKYKHVIHHKSNL